MMRELIDRLEKATGPDRHLDFAIHEALWPSPPGRIEATPPDLPDGFGDDDFSHAMDPRPHYTGSHADALTLVPENKYWHIAYGKMRDDEPLGAAAIIAPGSLETIAEAEHESVIIALCIAAIKARALRDDECASPQ